MHDETEDIDAVVAKLDGFDSKKRCGLQGTLHRFSAIYDRADERIAGRALRFGRPGYLQLASVVDVICRHDASVLFVSPPGLGKTICLREFSRILADFMDRRVVAVVVDAAIEIDRSPHSSIGLFARRIPVNEPQKLFRFMLEAVENHSPDVLVIEEISTLTEAKAAASIRERGVRLVASAHGTGLASLMDNPQLQTLVDGLETVIVGDRTQQDLGLGRKVLRQRETVTLFDIVIGLQDRLRWVIHHDVARSVDDMMSGGRTFAECRERDPSSGAVHTSLLPV